MTIFQFRMGEGMRMLSGLAYRLRTPYASIILGERPGGSQPARPGRPLHRMAWFRKLEFLCLL